MTLCFIVSDLHGNVNRYHKLFTAIQSEVPQMVFLGGDLLPGGLNLAKSPEAEQQDFVKDYLIKNFLDLYKKMGNLYPGVFVILGNDDIRLEESVFQQAEKYGIWEYMHKRKGKCADYDIYGYSYIPPTPFLLKDWERYDVSRYVDPGSIAPEEGWFTTPVPEHELKFITIEDDLNKLVGSRNLSKSIFLFHAPPYKTNLDRAALDGRKIDHVSLDVHVGSIAIKRFIEKQQPLVTLHGHIHESAKITGSWQERIGNTYAFSAAHNGQELALVRFDLENLENASRKLI